MLYEKPLVKGTLIKRYKRFLADIRLGNGETVTAHCSNTGSMLQVCTPGSEVMLSEKSGEQRKTRFDWEIVKVNGLWAGVNTSVPNILLKEGFVRGIIGSFAGYERIETEKSYGESSRADAVLSGGMPDMYVEAKNVTLVENGTALFPDSVTARGSKHLWELMRVMDDGAKATLFLLSQRMDADSMGIAGHIDPIFRENTAKALKKGLEIVAWRANVSPEGIFLERELPFVL